MGAKLKLRNTQNMSEYEERDNRFKMLKTRLPRPGDIVECLGGEPAAVVCEHKKEQRHFYTSAVIDEGANGWFLKLAKYGIMVFIDRNSHEKLLNLQKQGKLTVNRLRITRRSIRGTALIGELIDE